MSDASTQPKTTTQAQRRATYGLNVAVAALTAVALGVLVNYIGAVYLRKVSPLDLTATGLNSLAPQTRKVIGNLTEDFRIITLFRNDGSPYAANITRARDLVDLYGRQTARLTVDHIDPDTEASRVEKLQSALAQRYAVALEPIRASITQAVAVLNQVREAANKQRATLTTTADRPDLAAPAVRDLLHASAKVFADIGQSIDQGDKQIARERESDMPAYEMLRGRLERDLAQLDEKVYGELLRRFTAAVEQPGVPNNIKNILLTLGDEFQQIRRQVQQVIAALRSAAPAADSQALEYEQVREDLRTQANLILILGPSQVRVLGQQMLFRAPDPEQIKPGERPELLFQGEDALTSALVSMTLKQPPLVVLVSATAQPMLGPAGPYNQVAERLRKMSFEVRAWSPAGQRGPMGQTIAPGPPPEARAGQPVVWVLCPTLPSNNPLEMMGDSTSQQTTEHLLRRMDAGDGVLLILTSPLDPTQTTTGNPANAIASGWGITPQVDRVIMRQFTGPDGRVNAVSQAIVTTWPDSLPITRALSGIPAVFVRPSPLLLPATAQTGTNLWPLAEITGSDLWAQTDLTNPKPKRDPRTAQERFVIAAAGQRGKARLVVVADPMWATDPAVAALPGNGELFVNSVTWLANLDQLIAASARSQDIRRVQSLPPGTYQALRWSMMAGIPLAAMLVGVAVWLVRRRG